jgi:hypothetical protein
MKILSLITLLTLLLSPLAQAETSLTVKLPASWIKLNSQILLNKTSTIYAKKQASAAQVIQHSAEIKPVFQDIKKEIKHHCRLYQEAAKGPAKIIDHKKSIFCLIPSTQSMYTVTRNSSATQLHHFKFNHMTNDEVEKFVQQVEIK